MLARTPGDTLDDGPRKTAVERRCAASGVVRPVDDMIRFVVAPDGAVVADLKRRLPGRGVWVTATRAALTQAVARKAFARSFKRDVGVPADLPAVTERLLERAALDALAIAYKAGRVVAGFAKVESALAHGEAAGVLHAADAAADGVRKLQAALRRGGAAQPTVIHVFTSAQLDLALGRANVVHAALVAGPETRTFLERAERLQRFRTGTDRNAEETERNG